MSFDNPRLLAFLFLLLPVMLVVFLRHLKLRKGVHLFAASAPGGEREALVREYRWRMLCSDSFFLLFLGFVIIALAGPRWGVELAADFRRGLDVVLALDVSRSMDVQDCPPIPGVKGRSSRIQRGLVIARDFTLEMDGIRLGTAVGKGRGVLTLPLTYDSEAVLNFLDSLGTFTVTGRGTNLESLIEAAAGAFKDSMPGRRAILLFSDGEALSGSLEAALGRVRDRGIVLCAVGLGSGEGGPVPAGPGTGGVPGSSDFLLSEDGSAVISSRQGEFLKNTVERSGGIYVDGNRNDAVVLLAEYFASLSADSGFSGHTRESKARWQLFVLAALVSLGVSRLLGFRWRRKKAAILGALLFFLSLTASSCSRIQGKLLIMEGNFYNSRGLYTEAIASYLKALDYDDAAPYAEYGLGSAYFALEEGRAALERYAEAEKSLAAPGVEDHPELKYRIQYNSGIIHFEKGEYQRAAEAFRRALEIDGSRIEAKRNLELSLLTLSRASRSETPSSPGKSEAAKEGAGPAAPVLFEYLRLREQEQWKSKAWAEEDASSGLDY
ncbi:MAG: tetratricopeptide repeat protein [Treponema sp.]|jgi:Ca-activated chloride channel family protein|nr:tetratricopeptide repeat protein [Treponema sp.]